MTLQLVFEMILASVGAAALYTLIGIAPGTDETAVLAPVTLALVLLGVEPIVVLAFFISAVVTLNLTDAIPVAVAGIPGGVMAAPMVPYGMILKKAGQSVIGIEKMASGAVIGTLVAVPVSLILASFLAPLSKVIAAYSAPVFFFGALFLALMSRNKVISILVIIPFAMLIQGLRYLYWGVGAVPETTTVSLSFFLGITIGPMIFSMLALLNKDHLATIKREDVRTIVIPKASNRKGFPNPFKLLTKKEAVATAASSLGGSLTFFMSPVGMTILFGEAVVNQIKDPIKKARMALASMDGLAHSTYIAGILIPLIALGIPLSPVAIGPANPLFNAAPVFTADHNMHHVLSYGDFVWATLIGSIIGLGLTYFFMMKYATHISRFVFKYIPHEAILGLFISLVAMLAYMDGGLINIAGVVLVAIVSGALSRLGVNYGVLFMAMYAAPWMLSKFF
ncbi:tripartite tricarboxylate transporter TctA family protein [Brochothrix thermosphacta]|uniref:tripartite tricarboxylate transporter permease n=1 Tax=Brochothrix thermosphacta TaxID=2756 RepID=UPI000E7659CB|nr:tripartite tricarboxylate transporter permease [Brochothrix thermosphacta]ANZ95226.1 tripartite tricarboxylate transporter TctA family protein [Brochothrix thermosphacta]